MLQRQRAAGHRHPEPRGHSLKAQADGQEEPQNNPAGISPAAGLPRGKITGAAYKKGLESALWGETRREPQGEPRALSRPPSGSGTVVVKALFYMGDIRGCHQPPSGSCSPTASAEMQRDSQRPPPNRCPLRRRLQEAQPGSARRRFHKEVLHFAFPASLPPLCPRGRSPAGPFLFPFASAESGTWARFSRV